MELPQAKIIDNMWGCRRQNCVVMLGAPQAKKLVISGAAAGEILSLFWERRRRNFVVMLGAPQAKFCRYVRSAAGEKY